ncbi:hypothetical protein HHK36_023970 [Tetracentron sinense]|uniref:Replication factor A C-terminal domain-containing protein n=1 Tax=Tetracentron sinense TaxID=13715 RepID=A0A835D5W4_TETSI|nr:hypothetical protein HHK36_023970 [Tetracentron sinense]
MQTTFYTVKGTIMRINSNKPYWYAACTICKKKVHVNGDSTTCVSCDIPNPSVLLRFCMNIDVRDFSTEASFVLFNNEVEYLLGCKISDFQESNLQAIENSDLDIKIKSCLLKYYWFQIQLAPENHRYLTMQGFTVSKLEECDYNDDVSKLPKNQCKRYRLDAGETSSASSKSVLRQKNGRYGIGGVCNGGGAASALVLELISLMSARIRRKEMGYRWNSVKVSIKANKYELEGEGQRRQRREVFDNTDGRRSKNTVPASSKEA